MSRAGGRSTGKAAAAGEGVPAAVRRQRIRDTLLRTFAARVANDCHRADLLITQGGHSDPLRCLLEDLRRDAAFLVREAKRGERKR